MYVQISLVLKEGATKVQRRSFIVRIQVKYLYTLSYSVTLFASLRWFIVRRVSIYVQFLFLCESQRGQIVHGIIVIILIIL